MRQGREARSWSTEALAFWLVEPGRGEIRPVPLREPGADEVRVRAVRSAISRGTESLVFSGRVPATESSGCGRRSRRATSPRR